MIYSDPDFGTITVTVNSRARRITMRAGADGLRVTVPRYATHADIASAIEKYREPLKSQMQKAREQKHTYDFNYSIETDRLQLHLIPGDKDGFYINRSQGKCDIVCPRDIDFAQHQPRLEKIITEQLRVQAKVILYNRVLELARLHGFQVSSIKIQSSRTRWGSCSGRNSINLSLYLMTLPGRLIDYVILHELCHTVHHDHSAQFWHLMDQVTEGHAQALDREMNQYKTEV